MYMHIGKVKYLLFSCSIAPIADLSTNIRGFLQIGNKLSGFISASSSTSSLLCSGRPVLGRSAGGPKGSNCRTVMI